MRDNQIIKQIAKYNKTNISNDLLTKLHKILLIAYYMNKIHKNNQIHIKDHMKTIITISPLQIYTKMNNRLHPEFLNSNQ